MKKILLILTSTILLQACESCNCPDDVDKGDCYLTQNTIDFVPYDSSQHYVFVAANANEIAVAVTKELSSDKKMIALTCTKPMIDSAMDYVDTAAYWYQLKVNDTTKIYINQRLAGGEGYMEVVNPAAIDTNFVDQVDIGGMRIITDYRGKTLVNPITPGNQGYSYHNSITVVDSTFTAVYANFNETIFYTKANGIVGFKKDGVLYRYKRQL